MQMRATIRVIILAVAFMLSACSTPTDDPARRDGAELDTIAEAEVDEFAALVAAGDESFRHRADRLMAEQAIENWEEALDGEGALERPDYEIAEVYTSIARAHYFIARYHEADGPVPEAGDDIVASLSAGVEAAEEALELRAPAFHRSLDRGAPFEEELAEAPVDAVESLLWYAKNLDLLARLDSVSATVTAEPVIDEVMEFVAEHRPQLHFGAAHRYFGVRWIERPFNRSAENSAQAFDESLRIEPDFLMTRLLRARYLATAQDDQEAFKSDLRAIIEAPDDALPEASAENAMARQWAAELLERSDEIFGEEVSQL